MLNCIVWLVLLTGGPRASPVETFGAGTTLSTSRTRFTTRALRTDGALRARWTLHAGRALQSWVTFRPRRALRPYCTRETLLPTRRENRPHRRFAGLASLVGFLADEGRTFELDGVVGFVLRVWIPVT